jgi:phenylacetate-CoA ligase
MNIFDRRYETMPRAELEQLQLERLQNLLVRLKRNVRRYREEIADVQIESLADLSKLPLTTAEDVARSFPYGMFALPLREVIRLHSTVGPEGQPLVVGHTRNDLAQWGRLVARQLVASGVTANDVMQLCLGGGIYEGAAGFLFGAQVVEASVIAEDPLHVDHQLAMLQNYRPTVLITTPANAMDLIQAMEQRHFEPQSLQLRTVLLSRPVDHDTREQLRAGLFAAIRCIFGIDEILNPGFSVACEAGQFHINEDQFLVEIQQGQLVVTTLCREAMPLLRYTTSIAAEISYDKCACGRTGVLIRPGQRLDRRLYVNEIPLYESQIAAILAHTKVARQKFKVKVLERHIIVSIEMTTDLFTDTIWPLETLCHQIEAEYLARLGIVAKVRFTSPPTIGEMPPED